MGLAMGYTLLQSIAAMLIHPTSSIHVTTSTLWGPTIGVNIGTPNAPTAEEPLSETSKPPDSMEVHPDP